MENVIEEKLLNKLLALKVLVERGEDGEKNNAKLKLDELMEKYSITEKQIEAEIVKKHEWEYADKYQLELYVWVIYDVTGGECSTKIENNKRYCSIICSEFEADEIDFLYHFYKYYLDKEAVFFVDAFCKKQGLLHSIEPGTRYYEEMTRIKKESDERNKSNKNYVHEQNVFHAKMRHYQTYFDKQIPIREGVESSTVQNAN